MIVPLYVSSGKRAVAVLTPHQVQLIEDHLNADNKIRTRFLLYTAARIAEARYIEAHPETFRKENGAIFLPKVDGMGKKRCTVSNRAILLSVKGIAAVQDFFEKKCHIPTYQSLEPALKLAAKEADFDTRYITTKMYRKTMISWLIQCWPQRESAILLSAGHTQATMRGHYLGTGFRKDDIADMQDRIEGWGEAR